MADDFPTSASPSPTAVPLPSIPIVESLERDVSPFTLSEPEHGMSPRQLELADELADTQVSQPNATLRPPADSKRFKVTHDQLSMTPQFLALLRHSGRGQTTQLSRVRIDLPRTEFYPVPTWLRSASKAQKLWLERIHASYVASLEPPPSPLARLPVLVSLPSPIEFKTPESRNGAADGPTPNSRSRASLDDMSSPGTCEEVNLPSIAMAASIALTPAMTLEALFTTLLTPAHLHTFDQQLRGNRIQFAGHSVRRAFSTLSTFVKTTFGGPGLSRCPVAWLPVIRRCLAALSDLCSGYNKKSTLGPLLALCWPVCLFFFRTLLTLGTVLAVCR